MSLVLHPKIAGDIEKLLASPPHALLLVAPEGAGKHAVAMMLAGKLLNVAPEKLANTADLLVVEPDKDEAFGIDTIRTAQHFMTLKATNAQKQAIQRIALLPDAHTMTREAQNALLKLLEEPPVGSMLILTATSEHALLPTVVSRCQVVAIRKPATKELIEALVGQGNSAEAAGLAVRISDGWPGLATAIVDPAADHPFTAATQQARALLQQPTFERLITIDTLAKKREQCADVCYILQQMAHVAIQTANDATIERWQRVLTASYTCHKALQARANVKLCMTQLALDI
jgi:replication-associated recombination protein RarA